MSLEKKGDRLDLETAGGLGSLARASTFGLEKKGDRLTAETDDQRRSLENASPFGHQKKKGPK